MFKITPILPPRILPPHTKLYDFENQGQGHFPLMTPENYSINH